MAHGGRICTERTPRVAAARKLLRRTGRDRSGRFLAEGAQAVGAALASAALARGEAVAAPPGRLPEAAGPRSARVARSRPVRVRELFATEPAASRHTDLLVEADRAGIPVSLVSQRAAELLSETVTPQGLVAVCDVLDVPLADALDGAPSQLVVLVHASDPGNAGTVIRVADAAGADAVVLAGDSVDPHNGKCVRASAGSVFHLPLVRERDVDAVLAGCRAEGLQLLAATAAGETDLHDPAEGALWAQRSAWLFGSEAHGLPAEIASAADRRVRVPVYGRAESLNLATAAAVCVYATAGARRAV
ncbi:MAG TPA: RNA methyltransferase [Pseudonocardia sp.]|jgi:TrmH family RNA methyltransferase|uniref:TrmH family RNA methyltransferase n=1 Tax=Pseudonocardia sp. TaxID=60912 RepID=UPI002F41350A